MSKKAAPVTGNTDSAAENIPTNTKCIAIIQARMGSSRLPRKIALDCGGVSILERVITVAGAALRPTAHRELSSSSNSCFDEIWVATSDQPEDDVTSAIAQRCGALVYRGSMDDVRSRFINIIAKSSPDIVCRITADNPLTYRYFIEEGLARLAAAPEAAYLAYDHQQIPYGSGIELFRAKSLTEAAAIDSSAEAQEHVTPTLRKSTKAILLTPADSTLRRPDLRVTVDTLEDYLRVHRWFSEYGPQLTIRELCK